MTPKELRQLILEEAKTGRKIQFIRTHFPTPYSIDNAEKLKEKKRQLWSKPEDVAPFIGCLVRQKEFQYRLIGMITGATEYGICAGNTSFQWQHIGRLEYSTDIGKPLNEMKWKECEVES